MRRLLLLLVVSAGCRQIAGLNDPLPGDGGEIDRPPGGEFCYGTGLVKVCFSVEPSGPISITTNIDTGVFGCSANVTSGGTGLCVIAGATVSLPAGTTVAVNNPTNGMSIPLVLIATDSITISGTLDAAGHHQGLGTTSPGGSGFNGCLSGTNPVSGNPAGGGQAGSFLAKGGDGGAGGAASGGGAGAALSVPTMLHGGCAGHSGGNSGGSGGKGGGAVYLIAVHSITIASSGRIDTSGSGGSGNGDNSGCGGGAGGSGGMIGLDAPTISHDGAVCAIGGSGAAGAGVGGSSQSGGDATGGSAACTVGTPGNAGTGAGDGGAGATSGIGAAGAAGSTGGGGGGGGSSGYIKLFGTPAGTGDIQPPPV